MSSLLPAVTEHGIGCGFGYSNRVFRAGMLSTAHRYYLFSTNQLERAWSMRSHSGVASASVCIMQTRTASTVAMCAVAGVVASEAGLEDADVRVFRAR